jgi:beta-glucosidase
VVVGLLLCCGLLVSIAEEAPKSTTPTNRVNTALIPKPGGSETWWRRHEAMNARARKGDVGLVYIGDSIVNSWQWDGEPVWKQYYEPRKALVCGITGDRTEQVLWRLQHGNIQGISPKLAILMIGQNNGPSNTGEEIGAGIAAIVQLLQTNLPTTKILLLAIFPRGEKVTPERQVLATANAAAAKLADGKQIFYLDINHLFLESDGGVRASRMPDFEHPNENGHRVWASAIEPLVAKLMGDTPIQDRIPTPDQPHGAPSK